MSGILRSEVLSLGILLIGAATSLGAVAEAPATNLRAPKTEAEWQVCEIVRDAAEMLVYAKTRGLAADGLVVGFLPATPDSPVVLGVQVAKDGTLVTEPLFFPDFAAAPEPYVPLLAKLLASLHLSGAGKQTSDGPAFLDHLTDIRTGVLSAENVRISAWLEGEPLNPDAHEEAAFLVAILGLKEQAGYFFDDRSPALRAAAHLAVASALRKGDAPSPAGRFAREALRAIDGDETGVRTAMRAFRAQGKISAGEKAWTNALELYATSDWTLLDKPFTATLVERFMYCRALRARISRLAAFEFLTKRNTEPIPDWSRLLFDGSGPVPIGNAFAPVALPQQLAELGEAAKKERDLVVKEGVSLDSVLRTPATRGVEAIEGHVRLRPISWSMWSRFFERHLMATGLALHWHLARTLRKPDQAKEVRVGLERLFAGCRWEPLLRARLAEQKAQEERTADQQPVWTREPETMTAAASYVRSHPEEITAPVWYSVGQGAPADIDLAGLPYRIWFGLEGEGPRDGLRSFFSPYNIKFLRDREFETLKARKAYDSGVLLEYSTRHYNRKPSLSQFDELYGALAASDLMVMKWRAEYFVDDMARYREQYEKIASLDPREWGTLAERLIDHDREPEAAAAYRKMVDEVQDAVFVSNEVGWLVDYDIENGKLDEAGKLARAAGETYSGEGLGILARYFEARGDLESAESTYKKLTERYGNPEDLHSFYIRRHRLDPGRYASQAADAEAKRPLERVELSDFKGPPTDGAEVVEGSLRAARLGLNVGSVVGALDGFRVRSFDHYRFVRALTTSPDMRIIFWDGTTWREVQGRFRSRRFGTLFKTFSKKT